MALARPSQHSIGSDVAEATLEAICGLTDAELDFVLDRAGLRLCASTLGQSVRILELNRYWTTRLSKPG